MQRSFHNAQNINAMAQQQAQNSMVKVSVSGWQGATKDEMVNFVSRKCKVAMQDSVVEGPLVIGFVKPNDVDKLLGWSGVRFAGNALKFQRADSGSGTLSTIELLKNFLFSRYDAQNKMLDLTAVAQDPTLVANGLFASMSTSSKMFPALMKLAGQESGLVVESCNLSGNNLDDIAGISSLSLAFPGLKNLALMNNRIKRTKSLEVWKNKFKNLQELLLVGNPVTSEPNYPLEMVKLFPKILTLDGVPVRDGAKLSSIFTLPVPLTQQFFFENDTLGGSSTDFVSNFLNLWDSNRDQLLSLYTPQSQFSICVDSSTPTVGEEVVSFGYYLTLSRNQTKVSSEKSKEQRLHTGQDQIRTAFKSIPGTKHILAETPDEYSVESWSYPEINGFVIVLHGCYDETVKPEIGGNSNNKNRRGYVGSNAQSMKLGRKSFDRMWIVVPNPQGGIVVASDMLTVRGYSGNPWIKKSQPGAQPGVQPMGQPGVQPMGQPGQLQLPPDVASRLQPIQLELLNKLHSDTRLKAEFVLMLAEQAGWNYDNAMRGFQESRQSIPPHAFE